MRTQVRTACITVDARHRTDIGDITELAASISAVGLLNPLVVTSDNALVAGTRRLTAVKSLGLETVDVIVIKTRLEAADALKAQQHEASFRKPFTFEEAVATGAVIDELIKPLKKGGVAEAGHNWEHTRTDNIVARVTGHHLRSKKRRKTKEDEAALDWNTIPGNQRDKLERARNSIRKELEREFHTRLLAEGSKYRTECDANVASYKAKLDVDTKRERAERDEERRRYQEGIDVYRAKGLITRADYDLLRSCLHPDSRASVTDEKLSLAFRLFNDSRIKTLLVKEK